jgi:4-hydroxy-tetrahydrodipicolinate synthase
MAARFGSVVTAMVTPFDDAGAIDLDGARRLARWLADHGSQALVVAGSTGESTALDDEERRALARAVVEAVTVPVIVGTGSANTRHSVELTRDAEVAGAAGVLVVTPYYSRPSQQGLRSHFEAVAEATNLPVILYDIPARTGRRLAADTVLRLARAKRNVVALKDSSGDVAGAARLMAELPSGFELYSGDDALALALGAVGSVGVVSVASHWAGPLVAEMFAALGRGDLERARQADRALLASYAFESSERWPNPLPAKAACRALGLPAGQCRLPLGPGDPELDVLAKQIVDDVAAACKQLGLESGLRDVG